MSIVSKSGRIGSFPDDTGNHVDSYVMLKPFVFLMNISIDCLQAPLIRFGSRFLLSLRQQFKVVTNAV